MITNVICSLLLVFAYLSFYINPEYTTFFSFIGLGFPFALFTNIFFFIYWLYKRNKYFFISLLTLIAGFYHTSRFVQFTLWSSDAPENTTSLKIMSYNVRLFDLYNWTKNEKTRDQILTFLKEEDSDIICFQEYYYTTGNHFDTRDTLIQLLDSKHYFEHFTTKVKESKKNNNYSNFGSAIYSKFPIINSGVVNFENDHTNNCIYVDLQREEDTIRVFNAHLGSIRFQSEDYDYIGGKGNPIKEGQKPAEQKILGRLAIGFKKRVSQSNTVLKEIENSPYPVIVCTDMNDTPISYSYSQFSSVLNDAFTISGSGIGGTYIGNYPFLRIDYIWYDDYFNSCNFVTHQQELSDHKAVSCTVYN